MAQRSKVLSLPDEVKAELDKRLVRGGFCDYVALSEWLCEQGYEISKSAIHRYGQAFDERLSAIRIATEQARAVTEAARDEEGAMNEALIRLVQQEAFKVLVNLNDEDKNAMLPKVGLMVAKLSKAAVGQKKWASEVKTKAEVFKAGFFMEFMKEYISWLSRNDADAVQVIERNFDPFMAYAKEKYVGKD